MLKRAQENAASKLSHPLCQQRLLPEAATVPEHRFVQAPLTFLQAPEVLQAPQASRLPREALTKARCLADSYSACGAPAPHSGCSVALHETLDGDSIPTRLHSLAAMSVPPDLFPQLLIWSASPKILPLILGYLSKQLLSMSISGRRGCQFQQF